MSVPVTNVNCKYLIGVGADPSRIPRRRGANPRGADSLHVEGAPTLAGKGGGALNTRFCKKISTNCMKSRKKIGPYGSRPVQSKFCVQRTTKKKLLTDNHHTLEGGGGEGLPTLAGGYLPWPTGYLPWLGVPTLGGKIPNLPWGIYPGWGYLPCPGGYLP